ncbi:hypothetical protein BV22DRAFT_1034771 [Leucogyrophana mollusca]|uniref:Uncharacterized protein n=1 Tax=Leucogyrophana mollusca TaxID=85980 RepID=A0ACB8BGD4_9AGAM|nr:hypothetical protein BV22DRAFT_1034771 [Leucogyrophana mollusca]
MILKPVGDSVTPAAKDSKFPPKKTAVDVSSLEPSVDPEVFGTSNAQETTVMPESLPFHLLSVVQRVVDDKIPLSLINLEDGKVYSSSEIPYMFAQSPEYVSLGKLNTSSESNVNISKAIEVAVCSWTAFAMLSHRRGRSDVQYHELKGTSVYQLPSSDGVEKLKGFCRTAKSLGLNWAWADTCCIDTSSSAELQESINSSFHWYRNSAITIVYLADVAQPSPNAFHVSEWFKRGWTVHELLAPSVIQFYLANWSLYYPRAVSLADNDKSIPELRKLISDATKVDERDMISFIPGTDRVREKFRWLSDRNTTKIEDMAYCLMGIFGVHLPILYGERERAFTRLQEEIMKHSDDTSLFDWVGRPSTLNSFLASQPNCFSEEPFMLLHDVLPIVSTRITDASAAQTSRTSRRESLAFTLKVLGQFIGGEHFEAPTGHFIANGKLRVTLGSYRVDRIVPTSNVVKPPVDCYQYDIHAQDLQKMTITTLQRLHVQPEERRQWNYILVRLREVDFLQSGVALGGFTERDVKALYLKPFVAVLLEQASQGVTVPCRRVLTVHRIVAQPIQDASARRLHTSRMIVVE